MNWIWNPTTHILISKKALQKMSPFFNELVNTYPEYFELGILAPDKLFCDTTNHYYNCTPNASGYHYGRVVEKVVNEIALINCIIDNHSSLVYHHKCDPYLKHILDNPIKIIVFELGVISHYLADLHQPFHTDGSSRFEFEEVPHKIYEADVRKHFYELQLDVGVRRYRIRNISDYLYERITCINRYYDSLINYYFLNPKKVKPDRWAHAKRETENFISLAAKCISNVWFLFEESVAKYKKILKNVKILQHVQNNIDFDKSYSMKIYNSGTMSVRSKG